MVLDETKRRLGLFAGWGCLTITLLLALGFMGVVVWALGDSMILDVSPEGRARMRRGALEDLDEWMSKEAFDAIDGLVAITVRVPMIEGRYPVVLVREGRKRNTVTGATEYPPRSTWWYMRDEGDGS